jgi:hypothetical protein
VLAERPEMPVADVALLCTPDAHAQPLTSTGTSEETFALLLVLLVEVRDGPLLLLKDYGHIPERQDESVELSSRLIRVLVRLAPYAPIWVATTERELEA